MVLFTKLSLVELDAYFGALMNTLNSLQRMLSFKFLFIIKVSVNAKDEEESQEDNHVITIKQWLILISVVIGSRIGLNRYHKSCIHKTKANARWLTAASQVVLWATPSVLCLLRKMFPLPNSRDMNDNNNVKEGAESWAQLRRKRWSIYFQSTNRYYFKTIFRYLIKWQPSMFLFFT